MKKNIFVLVGFIIVLVFLAVGVSNRFVQQNTPIEDSGRMQVVASFYPLAHIAERVGKEYVEVLNLTPVGSEPHDFDPSPRDVATLHNASVFIYNGAGLEPWALRIIPELIERGVRVVEATHGTALLAGVAHEEHTDGEEHSEEDEHEEEYEENSFDPHVWLDPVLYQQQVSAIAEAFGESDAVHADEYTANAASYSQELATLHQEFLTGLATCKRRDIVVSHAAFTYLANRYDLRMIPISGLSPDAEPTPSRLAEISNMVREGGITHIFFEALVSPRIAETIARETGAQTIALNPLEGLTGEQVQQGNDYISVQRENLRALRIALDCI